MPILKVEWKQKQGKRWKLRELNVTNIHAAHAATQLFGGAQPRREAFVVVREEDGLGILENRKNKEKHTKNGGQLGLVFCQ